MLLTDRYWQQQYRDVRESGVLGGGKCLGVRRNSANALMPQRGADEVERAAVHARNLRRAHRMIRAQKAISQGANSLKKPNKT